MQSGDIRLFSDFSRQRKIRMIAFLCETFNHFIDNTENILATLLLKPDSLGIARQRLEGFAESAKETRKEIINLFTELELDNEHKEGDMAGTRITQNEKPDGSKTTKELLREIKNQLEETDKAAKYYFHFSLGIAALTISLALALFSQYSPTINEQYRYVALLALAAGFGIMILAMQEYRPERYHPRRLLTGIILMICGATVSVIAAFDVSLRDSFGLIICEYQNIGGLITLLVGLMISTWSARRSKKLKLASK